MFVIATHLLCYYKTGFLKLLFTTMHIWLDSLITDFLKAKLKSIQWITLHVVSTTCGVASHLFYVHAGTVFFSIPYWSYTCSYAMHCATIAHISHELQWTIWVSCPVLPTSCSDYSENTIMENLEEEHYRITANRKWKWFKSLCCSLLKIKRKWKW